jgi:hypothetical protein
MNTFLTVYLVLAVVGSSAFVLGSVRGQHKRGSALPTPDDTWIEAADPFDNSEPADVRTAAAIALRRVMPLLDERGIRLTVAIRAGLLVQEPGHRLADVLERILIALVRNDGSHMVLSAAPRGGQVAVRVSNDARAANVEALQAQVRSLSEEVALRGGALDLDVAPQEGVSVVLRVARFNGQPTLERAPHQGESRPQGEAQDRIQPVTANTELV